MKVRSRKLKHFGRCLYLLTMLWTYNRAENLSTSIIHGRIENKSTEEKPRKNWTDDIRDWTKKTVMECIRSAQDRRVDRAGVIVCGRRC